jgi:hypothetical protein
MLGRVYCRIMYGIGCCYGWDLGSAELRTTDRTLMMRDASLRDKGARCKSSVVGRISYRSCGHTSFEKDVYDVYGNVSFLMISGTFHQLDT